LAVDIKNLKSSTWCYL